jgi:hypothetical protein
MSFLTPHFEQPASQPASTNIFQGLLLFKHQHFTIYFQLKCDVRIPLHPALNLSVRSFPLLHIVSLQGTVDARFSNKPFGDIFSIMHDLQKYSR